MNIISMTLSKIEANKKGVPRGKMNVASNVKIESLEETKIGIDKTKTSLRLKFSFTTVYQPDFADMRIEGDVLMIEDPKVAKVILDKWKKNKEMDQIIALDVMNNVMAKCSIEAVVLARELGLPSPIQLPRIRVVEEPAPSKPSPKEPKKEAKEQKDI